MTERVKGEQLLSWLDDALRGDLGAKVNLHNYLFPRLVRKVGSPLTEGLVPDLVIATLSRVDEILPDLLAICHRKSRRTISDRVIDWSVTQLNGVTRDYTNPHSKFRDKIEDFIPDYPERILGILQKLRGSELEAVSLMLENSKTIPEIAQELEISKVAVRQRLHRGRVKIEPELIKPYEIKRAASLNDINLQHAISRRYVEGFKFLDLWYTDKEAVQRYREGLRSPGENRLE